MRNFIRKIYRFFTGIFHILSRIPCAIRNAKAKTYFSEGTRKKYSARVKDNLAWLFRYKEVNTFYTLYGLDLKERNADDYIDYLRFMNDRNLKNKAGKVDSQSVLLRDKFLFWKYMKASGLPVPEVFAVVKNGEVYDTSLNKQNAEEYLSDRKNYFIKDIAGECGSFVKRIADYEEFLQIKPTLKGAYILQEALTQSEKMNVLNPKAINTLRIVTIDKGGKIYPFSSVLRIGTSATGNVDNWARGGLSIGVLPSGFLKEYGFYKPIYGTKASIHPDTGIVFKEFQIPDYEQALKLVCEAHKYFYGLHSIGWDLAMTDTGFSFIEGNDNWEISLMQACDRPLKADWEQAIEKN